MSGFFSRLQERARAIDSLICVGLDPHPADIGDGGAPAALAFCRRIVAQTTPYALAFKPNAAFFEALGAEGVAALNTLVGEIEPHVPVILDAKRGDIASTAAAYARAAFDVAGAGAITLHPYLGWQALEPLLERADRGAFVLCRTTNPGADARQEAVLADGRRMFETIASEAATHPRADRIGLVAGGTAPAALARIRQLNHTAWLLVPGIGAQGADATMAVSAGLRGDGLGLLVSASRSIARAASPGAAAEALRDQVRAAVAAAKPAEHRSEKQATLAEVARALLDTGCVQFGSFVLKSGLESPIYLDLRRLSGSPEAMRTVARAYTTLLRGLSFERVAALPYAGLPLATAACLVGGWPMIYPRKTVKDHGRRQRIEGPFAAGDKVVIVDDLATRGTSVLEALPSLTAAGLQIRDVVVLVDRDSGAGDRLAEAGVRLHAVVRLRELLSHWRANGAVAAAQVDAVERFLQGT